MKACKKLLSLLLVAVLLVSAIPFQAMAAEEETIPFHAKVVIDGVTTDLGKIKDGGEEDELTLAEVDAAKGTTYATDYNLDRRTWEADEEKITYIFELSAKSGNGGGNEGGNGGGNEGGNGGNGVEPTPDPTPAPQTYNMTLLIYSALSDGDALVETKSAAIAKATVVDWMDNKNANISAILSAFGSSYAASDIDTTKGNVNTTQVVLVLNPGATGSGNSNPSAPPSADVDKFVITTNMGHRFTKDEGELYFDFLPTPAREGYTFKYWMSQTHGRVTASTYVTGNDHVEAVWEANDYTMTFVVSRDGMELIVAGKKYNMGDTISAADLAWGKEACAEYVPEGYVITGWKVNGEAIKAGDTYKWQGDVRAIAQLGPADGSTMVPVRGKVYLEVYVNGKTAPNEIDKRIEVPENYYSDGVLTRQEVLNLLTAKGLLGAGKRYSAKAGYTLAYDGLFTEAKWFEYCHDVETDGAAEINIVYNSTADKYISLMIRNVKVSTADTTNPKTGDYILPVSLTIMVMSAVAAAAVYVTSKKRGV